MDDRGASPVFDEPLDVFSQSGQQLGLYTQLCFCFSTTDDSQASRVAIVKHLNNGLERLASDFPWVAGNVVKESGLFRMKPGRKATPELEVQNLSSDQSMPTFSELDQASFPFRMLDERIIAPRSTLPNPSDQDSPVFLLKVTFLVGGLLLVINGQHNCMDMAGQSHLIYLFSKACRAEPFTEEEKRIGNLPRQDIVFFLPKLPSNTTSDRSLHKEDPIIRTEGNGNHRDQESIWSYFIFPGTALAALKSLASQKMTSSYVSTDDSLSAFVWQAVMRARRTRLNPSDVSTFDRQVNARRYLGLPEGYLGNTVYKLSTRLDIAALLSSPLGIVASQLRFSLISEDIASRSRAEATKIRATTSGDSSSGIGPIKRPKGFVPVTGIKMSSWGKEKCPEFNFGGDLGRAVVVRRPSFGAWEGLAYLLPRGLKGEIAFGICLRKEDLEALKSDAEFNKFGHYVG